MRSNTIAASSDPLEAPRLIVYRNHDGRCVVCQWWPEGSAPILAEGTREAMFAAARLLDS